MLQDLDKTLEKLLRSELPSDIVQQVNFSFDTPDRESIKVTPAINLFLYDVRENLELRNGSTTTIARQPNGSALKIFAPARVDCSYLITVWPTLLSDPEYEHRLLGSVMEVLMRHTRLPTAILQGRLKDQDAPLRSRALRTNYLQSMGEFWQGMGGRPKATLNYVVTISVATSVSEEVVPLVMKTSI